MNGRPLLTGSRVKKKMCESFGWLTRLITFANRDNDIIHRQSGLRWQEYKQHSVDGQGNKG